MVESGRLGAFLKPASQFHLSEPGHTSIDTAIGGALDTSGMVWS